MPHCAVNGTGIALMAYGPLGSGNHGPTAERSRMPTKFFRFSLTLVLVLLSLPGLALAASAASTAGLTCRAGSVRLADFELEGTSFTAITGAGAVSVTGDGNGGTFALQDTTKVITAVLIAGPDGPVATKTDPYPEGVSVGGFDPSSLVADPGAEAGGAPGAQPSVTAVAFCGSDATVGSAQCQDEPAFTFDWDGAGTFSVTLGGSLALCAAVEFNVGSYSVDEPAGWNGQSTFSDGAAPQTEVDHQLITFGVGAEPGTRSATVAASACGPYQVDLYRGARRTVIDASGHGTDFVRGGLLAGADCAATPAGPGEPSDGPTVGSAGEPQDVSVMSALDCVRSALVLTLTSRGAAPAAVDFTVDGGVHSVPAGENRTVIIAVAEGAAYSVVVQTPASGTTPASSQTFSGTVDCSTGGDGPEPTGSNVPSDPNGSGLNGSGPDGTDGGDGVVIGGAATPTVRDQPVGPDGAVGPRGTVVEGSGVDSTDPDHGMVRALGGPAALGGALAVTGPPDLVTGALLACTLVAVGAGLLLVGRTRSLRNEIAAPVDGASWP